jgi:hypothetical protein
MTRSRILGDVHYLAIRPHLKPEVREQMTAQTLHVTSDPYGTAGDFYGALIRDEADRLEREWKLV